MSEYCIGLCTCPDEDSARHLAERLVNEKLAACVNILPAITSVYRWDSRVHCDPELQLIVKTRKDKLADIEQVLDDAHPYDEPEWIVVDVVAGKPSYLNWITCSLDEV